MWIACKSASGSFCKSHPRSTANCNGLADRFVGEARGHSAFDEICGRGPGVHETRLRRLIHLGVVEFDGVHKSGHQRQHADDRVGGVEHGSCVSCKSLL
jgi:hypothetical protein